MNLWLVGLGYWGNNINDKLLQLGHNVHVIDLKYNTTIDQIDSKDPVIIATPPATHYNIAATLIKQGHDVLVEKPLAESINDVSSLMNLRLPEQIVMAGHIFMYNPLLTQIKDILESQSLGKIRHIHCERTNFGKYNPNDTSALVSLSPHDFSILDFLLGSLNITFANGIHLSDSIPHDKVIITGVSDSEEIPFQVDLSWLWPIRRRIVTIFCNNGKIVWDEDKQTLSISTHSIDRFQILSTGETNVIHNTSIDDTLTIELKHFIACCINRKQPKTGLSDAMKIAEYIETTTSLLSQTAIVTNPNH